jgi:light-regulated signal transduction histidine kinase (bacteriophytochrome)
VDCNEVVAEVMAMLVDEIKISDADIVIGELPVVTGDRVQLRHLFLNLIGNALKFSRPGVSPLVEVDATRDEDGWIFNVSDNGIGIEPESRERIFKMFQRLHGVDAFPGTGIGLAICRRVVDNHGGNIWVDGAVAGGASFKVQLREETWR